MIGRLRHTVNANLRVQIALAMVLGLIAVVTIVAMAYGETGIEQVEGARRVRTDGEHCAIILPDGWTWRPASWTAVSPNGTNMGFAEDVYGRPEYPEWQESVATIERRYAGRSDVTVSVDEQTVRVDFGPEGGLSVLQRFDRIGCRVTFSGTAGNRDQELPVWEQIIASLERTSPTGTPVEDLPWKTD